MKIETERLILREYAADDFDAIYEILSDPETMRGSAPRPGRGHRPLHPVIGASPQEDKCLVGYPCFGLAFPFGATPQNPARGA